MYYPVGNRQIAKAIYLQRFRNQKGRIIKGQVFDACIILLLIIFCRSNTIQAARYRFKNPREGWKRPSLFYR
jgi:hypothetical protein